MTRVPASPLAGVLQPAVWAPCRSNGDGPTGLLRSACSTARCDTEKHDNRPVQSNDVGVGKLTDAVTKSCTADRRDLVDHEPARLAQPVLGSRLDLYAEERRFGGVSRERAHRHRVGVEPIVLENGRWPWLAGVLTAAGNGPDLAPPHSSGQTDTESTKAWSSALCSLAAAALACRCASAANPGARTSGTQIWTGRSPWARRRARCSATRRLEAAVVAMDVPSLHVTIAGPARGRAYAFPADDRQQSRPDNAPQIEGAWLGASLAGARTAGSMRCSQDPTDLGFSMH